ncbi:TfoX/Sxy family protein [Candidatus Peribacteria bacterium]|nr:MAG: TfoX/Sxy family protein [Candidatus Peribacteria bacterium]
MATAQSTADYIVDQLSDLPGIRTRKMFGEYALYYQEKVIALICDDRLYVKKTKAGEECIDDIIEDAPYPGAKPYYLIDEARWEDREWLATLIEKTAAEIPTPRLKKK